ncbi:MAG: PspC domain-containing protein [Gammaproteobacteria bacterium]|nr:PspC domain-containing protein [Gammaproteobacteria bacterium]
MATRYRRLSRSIRDRKLGKDSLHKKLGGVCAGFARYLDVEPLFVRIIAVVALCIAPHATLLAYGIAYVVLDDRIY